MVVRVTLTPEPSVAGRFGAFISICSVVGSAQLVDRATGATNGVIPMLLVGDMDFD